MNDDDHNTITLMYIFIEYLHSYYPSNTQEITKKLIKGNFIMGQEKGMKQDLR